MPEIHLGNKLITENSEPYVIAEIGVNHEGSFELALRLIELAREGGAHAAKFQSYKAELIASRNSPSYWDLSKESTKSQFELFKKYDTFGPEEYKKLAIHCKEVGIDFLSTPFDLGAVDFLNPLMPFFKIASADITNFPLLKKIAAMGKPVVLSTGASRTDEIDAAINLLHQQGCQSIALLHCILNYPTPDENAHLNMICDLKNKYPDYIIGFSDHTLPDPAMTTLTTSYLKGARILEKHFTHDKTLPGNDHYHAMTSEDLKNYFFQLRKIRTLEGQTPKAPIDFELVPRQNARRSLVLGRAAKAGAVIAEDILICKRPGTGISPTRLQDVVGKSFARDLSEDHILTWKDIRDEQRQSGRVVGIIQARLGSTRFPRKMLADLGGKRVIDWVLDRVSQSRQLSEVVLAIPDTIDNDELAVIAAQKNISVFRGSESDVLDRYLQAALQFHADHVVRICADNPLVDPVEIDRLVSFYRESDFDYAFNHIPKMDNNYPDGLGAEILSLRVLQDITDKTFLGMHREHVTKFIWDYPTTYSLGTIKASAEWGHPEVKLDVDLPEDLLKLQAIVSAVSATASAGEIVKAALGSSLFK